jgi:hypothetical protein
LPARRQQDTQVVPVGNRRQAFEHFGQSDFGVVAVAFGAFAHPTAENPRKSSGFPSRRRSDSLREPGNGHHLTRRRDLESVPCDRSPRRRLRPPGRRSSRRKCPDSTNRTESSKIARFTQHSNHQRFEVIVRHAGSLVRIPLLRSRDGQVAIQGSDRRGGWTESAWVRGK